MRRILNALVQYRNSLLYIVLLGVCLLFLNGKSTFHQNWFEKFSLEISQGLHSWTHQVGNYFRLRKINDELLQENRILKGLEIKSSDLFLYPSTFSNKRRFRFDIKTASVIKNSFLNQRNYLIIDKGTADGIQTETAIISNKGIVGIIKSVSENYASVISILNQDLKINVRLKNGGAFGALSWKGTNPKKFIVEDVVMNATIKIGDTVVTGGMSSYFPLGIPVGTISSFDRNSKNDFYTIDVDLFEDPSQVYYVYILRNEDREEINTLKQDISK